MANPAKLNAHPKALIAAAANFIPGLGFFYLGRLHLALIYPVLIWAPLLIAGVLRWPLTLPGLYVTLTVNVVFYLAGIIGGFVLAKTRTSHDAGFSGHWFGYVLYLTVIVGLNLGLVVYRNTLLGFEPLRLSTGSMEPTLLPGDFFINNTWAYNQNTPQNGDVVIFQFPKKRIIKYVKRIIATPGDRLQFKDGKVYLNGEKLNEPYTRGQPTEPPIRAQWQGVVPDGVYFVMGDNRQDSFDSRQWGYLAAEYIEGQAAYVFFSVDLRKGTPRWTRLGLSIQ